MAFSRTHFHASALYDRIYSPICDFTYNSSFLTDTNPTKAITGRGRTALDVSRPYR